MASGKTKQSSKDQLVQSNIPTPDEAPNPVIRLSPTGKTLYSNPKARTIPGLVDPKTNKVHKSLVISSKASFKNGLDALIDYVANDKCFEMFINPVVDLNHINIYGRDVTEARESVANISGLAKFPAENPNPVLRTMPNGDILFANEAARALSDAILGGSPEKLSKVLAQAARSASRQNVAVNLNHKSKHETYQLTFAPVGGEKYLNVYGSEITAEIQAKKALEESNASLERRVAERTASVRLLQNIVLAANNAESLEAALQTALHEICIYTGWQVGHAYVVDGQNEKISLKSTGLWHFDPGSKYSKFRRATEKQRFGGDKNFPDEVLQSGKAAWAENLTRETKSERLQFARAAGLISAMAFPVLSDGSVVGVLEFFSKSRYDSNVPIAETLDHIGTQLGSVAKRKNSDIAVSASQADAAVAHSRLSNAIEVMGQGFALFDVNDNLVLFNKRYSEFMVEYGASEPEVGNNFADIVRETTPIGHENDTKLQKEAWVQSVIRDRIESTVYESVERTSTGRWLRAEGFDTEEGGTVSIFTDISESKRHEQELARLAKAADWAHSRLRDAVESIGQGFALFDADDKVVLFNQKYSDLITKLASVPSVGAKFSDMLTKTKRTEFKGLTKQQWMKNVLAERAQHGPRNSTNRLTDGTWYKAEGFRTSDGGNVSIFTDITDLKNNEEKLDNLAKEAELAHTRLNDAIEAIGQGFALFDSEDKYILFNERYQKMKRMLGEEAIVGASFETTMRATKRTNFGEETKDEWLERIIKSRKDEGSGLVTDELGDGSWFLFERYETAEKGNVDIFTDVTEMKNHETELDALVKELGVARDGAIKANSAKSQFLANMSHELRTPLNAIIGYSELLIDDANDNENIIYVPDLEKIQTAGKHLLGLINDILDLSKIEVGKVELFIEEFDVTNLLDDVSNTIKPLVEKNRNTLDVQISSDVKTMLGDITKLRQNLFNILSNAAKFSSDSVLSVHASRRKKPTGDLVVFEVVDHGIGMTPEHLDKVFDPFTQADSSTSKKFGGTGLGLSITREFCRMMGGDITVTSEFGVGTTFTMTVALNAKTIVPPAELPSQPITQSVSDGAPLVLVIDDDRNVRELLQRNLATAGYRTDAATNGKEGLQKARDLKPSAITLDVIMPEADGWSVLNALQSDPETADIPVIMVTIIEDRKRGFSLGASDYLSKPVDRQKLIDVLKRFLGETASRTVLLVEDDEASRAVIRRSLRGQNVDLIEAENGRIGIEKLSRTKPSLILLDLMMPEMDGFGFVDEYQKNSEWHDIPIIVVTSKTLSKAEKAKLDGWVDGFYNKLEHSVDQVLKDVFKMLPTNN